VVVWASEIFLGRDSEKIDCVGGLFSLIGL
jgi:hypothetical protein